MVGWIRHQEPNSERRGPRGASGWWIKATLPENTNRTLISANRDLMRRLDIARNDTAGGQGEVGSIRGERERMFSDFFTLRRDADAARGFEGRLRSLDTEEGSLCAGRDRLHNHLAERECESHSLLRELMEKRQRLLPVYLRSRCLSFVVAAMAVDELVRVGRPDKPSQIQLFDCK